MYHPDQYNGPNGFISSLQDGQPSFAFSPWQHMNPYQMPAYAQGQQGASNASYQQYEDNASDHDGEDEMYNEQEATAGAQQQRSSSNGGAKREEHNKINSDKLSRIAQLPGSVHPPESSTPTSRADKADAESKAAELRRKLIAARSNRNTPGQESSDPLRILDRAVEAPSASNIDGSDIDGLLAEGKAAADQASAAKERPINVTPNGQKHTTSREPRSLEKAVTNRTSTAPESENRPETTAETPSQRPATQLSPPGSQHQVGSVTRDSKYSDDLEEWLELTGYHDETYRERTLQRARKLAELDAQRAAIEQEAMMELDDAPYIARPKFSRAQSVRPAARGPPSAFAMPPPAKPKVTPKELTAPGNVNENAQPSPKSPNTAKHPLSPVATQQRPDKVARIDSDRARSTSHEYHIRGAEDDRRSLKAPSEVPLERRIAVPDRPRGNERFSSVPPPRGRLSRETSPTRRRYDDRGRSPMDWRRSSNNHERYNPRAASVGFSEHSRYAEHTHNDFSRAKGRDYHAHTTMRGGYSSHGSDGKGQSRIDDLNLRAGGTRYFIIKSWNSANVRAAQHDGVWATQPHNEQLLTEAFKKCKHVILVFSVNKSMAFQGYARMESLPGTAPKPSWTEQLLWPSSPPFYIRWITVAETHFRKVGHLKNALNDHQPVLVGRDGQEIEPNCGAALCELIDEEKERLGGY